MCWSKIYICMTPKRSIITQTHKYVQFVIPLFLLETYCKIYGRGVKLKVFLTWFLLFTFFCCYFRVNFWFFLLRDSKKITTKTRISIIRDTIWEHITLTRCTKHHTHWQMWFSFPYPFCSISCIFCVCSCAFSFKLKLCLSQMGIVCV